MKIKIRETVEIKEGVEAANDENGGGIENEALLSFLRNVQAQKLDSGESDLINFYEDLQKIIKGLDLSMGIGQGTQEKVDKLLAQPRDTKVTIPGYSKRV